MDKKVFALLIALTLLAGLGAACDVGAVPPTPTPPPTATPQPTAAPAAGGLKITGKVAKPMSWTEAQVKAMPTLDVPYTNKQGQTQTYTGVSIVKLLEQASVQADAKTLVFVADDGFTAEAALADVQKCDKCIVSFRSQGGFSTVMPDFPSNLQVKGVVEIQVK
jgi:hypothetical protein